MNRTYRTIRKFAIAILGSIVLVFGIILLVLPGPGLLVVILGLAILSLEFEWAEKRVEYLRAKTKQVINRSRNQKGNH